MSEVIRAALLAAQRSMCRERCAAIGEPACWQMRGDQGEELPWPPETCDCPTEAQVAVAAFLRALPSRFPLPRPGGQTWGHMSGEMAKIAAEVEKVRDA